MIFDDVIWCMVVGPSLGDSGSIGPLTTGMLGMGRASVTGILPQESPVFCLREECEP